MTTTRDDHVSTSQGACVFCNTVRPIEQVLCPACGRGWIDASASESAGSVARAEAEVIRTISREAALPVRRSTYRSKWWVPLVVAGAIFGAYWLAVAVLGESSPQESEPVAVPTTLGVTTLAPVELPPTTLPPVDTTTTTQPITTTTTVPPTTTTTLAPLPVGTAIPIDELRLGAVELGDIAFGTAADDVLPDLVATFGQPTAITDVSPDWGTCAGDTGRVLTFGGLHIVTQDVDGVETFAGYVLEPAGTASDTMTTFSDIGLGSTIGELDDTYRAFGAAAANDATSWVVSSFNDGRTLLWGTAAGTDDSAVVDRIGSPNACDGGPGSA